MNRSRFKLTIVGIDLCIEYKSAFTLYKIVAIPPCIKLGSSWKSLSIIYDRHGRNFNQTFKWGFAKTRRISYRKRVTGRVWHGPPPRLISPSYAEKTVLLSRNYPTKHLVVIFHFVSPVRARSLKVSSKICHFLSPFFNFNSFLKISFSSLFHIVFFFLFKSRMKAVIENRYYN